MTKNKTTAVACANIAFIKYWGNRDNTYRLPANASISMNLDGLVARTTVSFEGNLAEDYFELAGIPQSGTALARVSSFLDHVRRLAAIKACARVSSQNNFPTGAGIASSAAAFAALALAASTAAGLNLNQAQLSRLARLGSGSAARSIPDGFVEWQMGNDEPDSYAYSLAPAGFWDLVDCVAILAREEKSVGSTEGHGIAPTSPLQSARVADAPRRLEICRQAIKERDFQSLAEIVEQDSTLMHAVMMSSQPPLFYWEPVSLQIMKTVPTWRKQGLPCCFTLDAGPNVHVLCPADAAAEVAARLNAIPGVNQVLTAHPGGPARLE